MKILNYYPHANRVGWAAVENISRKLYEQINSGARSRITMRVFSRVKNRVYVQLGTHDE